MRKIWFFPLPVLAGLLPAGCTRRESAAVTRPVASAAQATRLPPMPQPAPMKALPDSGYKAAFAIVGDAPGPVKPGATLQLKVRVTNSGDSVFPATPGAPGGLGAVYLSYHFFNPGKKGGPKEAAVWEGNRATLEADLAPGAAAELLLKVRAPDKAGDYDLHLDLVHEGFAWFGGKNNPELVVPLKVS
jgi:hypothetical protein